MCLYGSQSCGNHGFKGPISAGNLQLGKGSLIQEIANIRLIDSILKKRVCKSIKFRHSNTCFYCIFLFLLATKEDFWEDITMHLRNKELCFTYLKVVYLHILFRIFLLKRFVYSPLRIYLLGHLFISEWSHVYLFCTLVIIQY